MFCLFYMNRTTILNYVAPLQRGIVRSWRPFLERPRSFRIFRKEFFYLTGTPMYKWKVQIRVDFLKVFSKSIFKFHFVQVSKHEICIGFELFSSKRSVSTTFREIFTTLTIRRGRVISLETSSTTFISSDEGPKNCPFECASKISSIRLKYDFFAYQKSNVDLTMQAMVIKMHIGSSQLYTLWGDFDDGSKFRTFKSPNSPLKSEKIGR